MQFRISKYILQALCIEISLLKTVQAYIGLAASVSDPINFNDEDLETVIRKVLDMQARRRGRDCLTTLGVQSRP